MLSPQSSSLSPPMKRKPLLSPHDADLVKRDAAIAGLATLLDPEAFLVALRSVLPGAELDAVRATYVRYKPGMSCLVAYELEIAGATITAYAKAYGPNALDHTQKIVPGRTVLQDLAI